MKISIAVAATTLVVAAISVSSATAVTSERPIAAFSIAAPNGSTPSGLIARAIVPAGVSCPILKTVDVSGKAKNIKMVVRANPESTSPAFSSLTACSAPIPANLESAHIGFTAIPAAMPTRIDKMAIFGDTGCRIKGSNIQNCSSTKEWPLARISAQVVDEQPDVIIFTGDFFYREGNCPVDKIAYCGSSPTPVPGLPFADTAESWQADVFTPMSDMLASAPIVLTRGNHEACNRGGNGYFIYFDPREGTADTCAPTIVDGTLVVPSNELTDPYAVDIKLAEKRELRIVNIDSSSGWDCEVSSMLPKYQEQFTKAEALTSPNKENWLLIHRPVFGFQPSDDCSPTGGWIVADQATASRGKLSKYNLLLSSHIHLVQSVNIPGAPGQLVIGNGGTKLEPIQTVNFPTTGPTWPNGGAFEASTNSWAEVRHGYAIAAPTKSGSWAISMKDRNGSSFATCTVAKAKIKCVSRR